MMNGPQLLQKILTEELARSRRNNPAYSLRAFSKKLAIGSGPLSLILQGKRQATLLTAKKLMPRLKLDPTERAQLLEAFFDPDSKQDRQTQRLDMDGYRSIVEWQHLALLSLLLTKNFVSELGWIAQRLGLSMTKTREAIRRLERLELIDVKWHASGEIKSVRRLANKLRTSDNIASLALQQAHAHTLDKAKESIFQIPIHQRDLSAMTMAIDPENLPAAREFTRQYLLNLAELLEQGSRTEVYKVSVQLFPLTELKRNPAQGKLK